jgi:hypothetical protein
MCVMESNINIKLLIHQARDLPTIVFLLEKQSQTSCISNQIIPPFLPLSDFTSI